MVLYRSRRERLWHCRLVQQCDLGTTQQALLGKPAVAADVTRGFSTGWKACPTLRLGGSLALPLNSPSLGSEKLPLSRTSRAISDRLESLPYGTYSSAGSSTTGAGNVESAMTIRVVLPVWASMIS